MFKMSNVKVPGGALLEFECATLEELFERANFVQGMPLVCPIDGSDTVLSYQKIEDNDYYSVRSREHPQYTFKYGRRKGTMQLFPKGWYEWDAQNKCNWFWRDGVWYAVDPDDSAPLFEKLRPVAKQSPSPLAGNGKQDYTEQVPVADRDALDKAIDAAFGGEDAPSNRLGADATDAQRGTMHSLGIALYGTTEKWNAARSGWCEWASAGAKDSSKALDTTEMKALISELEVKVRGMYDKLADRCNQARVRIDNVNPDQLFGVELAHSYTGALKTYKTSQAQRVAA